MSKKIIIVGALGYLGTELCRVYSGERLHNKIIEFLKEFKGCPLLRIIANPKDLNNNN